MIVDVTTTSAVVVCPACGWRVIRFTRAAAWTAARAHERDVHDRTADTSVARASRRTR